MEEQGVSSILVDLGDGELGIVTDRDLRSRVVAAGLALETPGGRGDERAGVHGRRRADERRADADDDRPRHPPRAGRSRAAGSCSASPPTSTCSPPRRERRSCCGARSPTPTDVDALRATGRPAATRRWSRCTRRGVAAARISGDPLGRRRRARAPADRAHRRRPGPAPGGARLALARQLRPPRGGSVLGRRLGDGLVRRAGADAATTCTGSRAAVVERARRDGLAAGPPRGRRDRRDVGELDRGLARGDRQVARGAGLRAGAGRDLDRARRPRDLRSRSRASTCPSLLRDAHPRPELLRLLLRRRWRASRRPASCATSSSSTPASTRGTSTSSTAGCCRSSTSPATRHWRPGATTTSTSRAPAGRGRGRDADRDRRGDARGGVRAVRRAAARAPDRASSQAGEPPDDLIDPKTLNPLTRRYLRDAFRAVAVGAEVADHEARVEHVSGGGERRRVRPATPTSRRRCRPRDAVARGRSLRARPRDHRPRRRDDEIVAFATMPIDGGRARVAGRR